MKGKQRAITPEFIASIGEQLTANKQVRCKLYEHGRLHIDRQLPFLCVHRHPVDREDKGTKNLLLGQPAYLNTSADPSLQTKLSELVYTIAQCQSNLFGGFLIIELWSREDQQEQQPITPSFHLFVPHHHVTIKTLDTLRNALASISLRQQQSQVMVTYQDHCAPARQPPLLTPEQTTQLNCVVLGLEVKPVYRDPISGELLPFALRALRHDVTKALKKTFYNFSHHYTYYRPAHYHALGRRALTKAVFQTDQRLAQISEQFDLLLHVTPVNASEAWSAFQQSAYSETPEFHYRPRTVDPALLKRELYQIPLEKIEDPTLASLFTAKREELDRQITLLNDRNSTQFLYGSIQLFGAIEPSLLDAAQQILAHTPENSEDDNSNLLNAEQFAQRARDELDYYRNIDPSLAAKVEVCNDITGILVSHGNFLIGSDAQVAPTRLNAALQHEIGTHVVTYHNGRKQVFKQLFAGMAGYEELQEGLAVLAEYLIGELDLSRLKILAGRVLAVHSIISGANFVETYQMLNHDYNFRPFTAFNMTMRVYRGGGYIKDMIYLRGFLKLLDYLHQDQDIDILYSGKVSLEQIEFLQELKWREVLKPIALRPRYLNTDLAQARIEALRNNPSLVYILGNL